MDLPEYITEGVEGALTVKLVRGLDLDGVKIKALTLREPNVGDQIAARGATDAEKEVALVANLAGHAPDDIRNLKMRDYGRVQEALGFFYG